MSYIDKSLGANETLHYRAHFHWIYRALAWGALIVAAIIAGVVVNGYGLTGLVVLIIGGAIFLWIMIPIWTTEIGVTNQRIIYKRGLVQRDTAELQLRNIEEVRFEQDFLGRILGYGSLEIHGTGEDTIKLPSVGDPLELRSALQEAMGNAQGNPPSTSGPAPTPGQPTMRAQTA